MMRCDSILRPPRGPRGSCGCLREPGCGRSFGRFVQGKVRDAGTRSQSRIRSYRSHEVDFTRRGCYLEIPFIFAPSLRVDEPPDVRVVDTWSVLNPPIGWVTKGRRSPPASRRIGGATHPPSRDEGVRRRSAARYGAFFGFQNVQNVAKRARPGGKIVQAAGARRRRRPTPKPPTSSCTAEAREGKNRQSRATKKPDRAEDRAAGWSRQR